MPYCEEGGVGRFGEAHANKKEDIVEGEDDDFFDLDFEVGVDAGVVHEEQERHVAKEDRVGDEEAVPERVAGPVVAGQPYIGDKGLDEEGQKRRDVYDERDGCGGHMHGVVWYCWCCLLRIYYNFGVCRAHALGHCRWSARICGLTMI